MKNDELLLREAIETVRASGGDGAMDAAAKRVAERLGIDAGRLDARFSAAASAIDNCDDAQSLLGPYRAGMLPQQRAMLIDAHLRDCGACRRVFQTGSNAVVDWSGPRAVTARPRRALGFVWAPAFAMLTILFFVYRAFWQVPPGVRAEVTSIDGTAYRVSDSGDRQLAPGDTLQQGDRLRTSGGAHAMLRLTDGSTVEVNERSELGVGARGRNETIALANGAVIVEAVKRTSGHLYVKTPDCRVAVTGTVFSVNAGIKGSRVAVLEGALDVRHAGIDSMVRAGDQVTTNDNLAPQPVAQQIAWSHDREKYLLLLAPFDTLQHRIEQLPTPALRYTSDLLPRVPASSMLYVSIPNLGEFLSQANTVFQEQLKQSPALQQWWSGDGKRNTQDLDMLVDKVHQMSQYLGDEIVIVGLKPGFAIVAGVKKDGLEGFLNSQLPTTAGAPRIHVLDESSLTTASAEAGNNDGAYALVRPHEVVFSNNVAMLKLMNAQLNAGAGGFAGSAFGQQVTAAYSRGAGIILAADLHAMVEDRQRVLAAQPNGRVLLQQSGASGVQYLIAEHRERNGLPENHLHVQFAGTREGVASWLAAPAPIGSLDFVTPNASLAFAGLSKDPAAIADDLVKMAESSNENGKNGLDDAGKKLHIDIRNDLAANLGGDFLVALDGPILPIPAWKSVIEVRDAEKLENTIERLMKVVQDEQTAGAKRAHSLVIRSTDAEGQRFYAVVDTVTGGTVAQYTFADGYMILAQDRAVLVQALHAHDSGDSLSRSAAFKALLPTDENADYSAVAYQNLSPVLQPLLSQFSGQAAVAVQQLAADARPTAVCAWGKDSTIEAASNSHLLGFDFLSLGTLLRASKPDGNQHVATTVQD